MKRTDINIRDPYVLAHEGKYYLYGTRSDTCWTDADGFDCYVGENLDEFEGPIEIFHRPEGFFATQNYWAPECYFYDGAFYFVTTLGAKDRKQGTYILRSENPIGPFEVYSDRITPENWTCIDATLYFEDGDPYLICSHSFEDHKEGGSILGDFVIMKLSRDLKKAVTEPEVLFQAVEAPWAKPFPYAKMEFGIDGDCYFSDGPSVVKLPDGKLYMTVSSWSDQNYAVGVAVSDSGKVMGPWRQQETPLWPGNGGHGMFFKTLDGDLVFTLHTPNDKYAERPVFYKVINDNGVLKLGEAL